MPKTYQRLKPEDYAARHLALRLKVQEGLPVETAARILNLPRSTARLWAAQDGFRLKDLEAEAAGAARPEVGGCQSQHFGPPAEGQPALLYCQQAPGPGCRSQQWRQFERRKLHGDGQLNKYLVLKSQLKGCLAGESGHIAIRGQCQVRQGCAAHPQRISRRLA